MRVVTIIFTATYDQNVAAKAGTDGIAIILNFMLHIRSLVIEPSRNHLDQFILPLLDGVLGSQSGSLQHGTVTASIDLLRETPSILQQL